MQLYCRILQDIIAFTAGTQAIFTHQCFYIPYINESMNQNITCVTILSQWIINCMHHYAPEQGGDHFSYLLACFVCKEINQRDEEAWPAFHQVVTVPPFINYAWCHAVHYGQTVAPNGSLPHHNGRITQAANELDRPSIAVSRRAENTAPKTDLFSGGLSSQRASAEPGCRGV